MGVGNECAECFEIITNPICSSCLAEQMRIMVGERNKELAEKIIGFDVPGKTICISCGKKIGVCAHCFSKDVYEYILEIDSLLAKEFMSRFNFDLRKNLVDFI